MNALDHLLAFLTAASVFLAHNVGYMLHHPFWIDESWVADSTRAPIALLPWLTSSTPLGWTLLLRLVPGGGQDLRILPLLFSAAAGGLGYYFGRELPLPRYLGGLLTGAAVVLVPAMLIRDDLKQYTAEACVSVAIMLLVARVERRWTRGRLAALVAVSTVGILVANSAVFVGVAAGGGLVIAAAVRKSGPQVGESLVALAATVGLSGILYELVDRRHVIPGLTSYWNGYYIPHDRGVGGAWSFIHVRFSALAPYMGSRWIVLDCLLALGGMVGMVWLRRVAVAVTLPLTLVIVMVASVIRRFPFGDPRTSTFWLVLMALYMAIGLACLVKLIADHVTMVIAVLATVAIVTASIVAVHPDLRSQPIPNEDVRSQVAYVNAHRHPGDIVILDYSASWGFAYYERELTPTFEHIDYATTGFWPTYPDVPWLVEMPNRNASDVTAAVELARRRLAGEGTRSTGRVWIIRSHMQPTEATAWTRILRGQDVETLHVGPEHLLLYFPS